MPKVWYRCSDSARDSSQRVPSTAFIDGMVLESQGVDVSCAFLRGKPREVEDPLFFEPPSRGLHGIEKAALVGIAKVVFGLPESPHGWWKELRDTHPRRLLEMSQTGPCLLLPE